MPCPSVYGGLALGLDSCSEGSAAAAEECHFTTSASASVMKSSSKFCLEAKRPVERVFAVTTQVSLYFFAAALALALSVFDSVL